MLFKIVKLETEAFLMEKMHSMLEAAYSNAIAEASNFNWSNVPEFDQMHYKNLCSMVYDGACPVRNIPITDEVLKRELWEYACCYTVSDKDDKLAYTYLIGKSRSKKGELSDKTKNALGLHVGDLNGVKLQDNFLSRNLGMMLFDVVYPDSPINFGRVPIIVRERMFNDSRNTINRNGETYELYDKDGELILLARPSKTFFTRRDAAQITYPRGGVKIFENPSVSERLGLLANLSERYNAKTK